MFLDMFLGWKCVHGSDFIWEFKWRGNYNIANNVFFVVFFLHFSVYTLQCGIISYLTDIVKVTVHHCSSVIVRIVWFIFEKQPT